MNSRGDRGVFVAASAAIVGVLLALVSSGCRSAQPVHPGDSKPAGGEAVLEVVGGRVVLLDGEQIFESKLHLRAGKYAIVAAFDPSGKVPTEHVGSNEPVELLCSFEMIAAVGDRYELRVEGTESVGLDGADEHEVPQARLVDLSNPHVFSGLVGCRWE